MSPSCQRQPRRENSRRGVDGKGTPNGNDLTAGMFVWSDGCVKELKRAILHNIAVAPGMDGDLGPADVDAVSAYVWAISHQPSPP